MKRKTVIRIIIILFVLVFLGIFLFAIYPKIKQNTCKKFDAEVIENGEQSEAAKQNETREPYILQPDDLTEIERKKAAKEFKEIMGIDIPNGVTINRYIVEDDGFLIIDLEFLSKDYDHVFQTIREAADNRLPLVFQYKEIYDPDLPNVFEYGWEERYFDLFPESTGQIHPIIEWYIDEPKSKSGAITGFTALALLQVSDDSFHIIFQND